MASFLQSLFSGKKKEFVSNSQTVKIEKDPNDPVKDILRFGNGKDDYFPVEGDKKDKEALREILSKVIESPTQLKKIKDLPLEDRPTLMRDRSGKANGMACGGYCSGEVISISPSSGTGYEAAGTFCHEFQHQYQHVKGDLDEWKFKKFTVSDKILNDRMCESAADTAKYQYMYEMKDKNLKARMAFEAVKLERPGLKAYAAAKDKGKSEQDCMLAGMQGYATDYMTAHYYAKYYNRLIKERDPEGLNADLYTDNVRAAVGGSVFQAMGMKGGKLDEFAAYKDHTVGMTTEKSQESSVRKAMRSAEFNYVTPTVARAITRWAKMLKKSGLEYDENPDKLNVRTMYGVTKNKERGGFAGLMFAAKTKMFALADKLRTPKAELGAKKFFMKETGIPDLILTTDKTGKPQATVGFSVDGRSMEVDAVKKLGKKEVDKRTETAQKMFGILMKQPAFKRQVEEMHKNGVEINLSFSDAVKEPRTIQGNTILLNPHQKPKQLADQFVRQFMPALREGMATKRQQAAVKAMEQVATVAKTVEPKAVEKQSENHAAPKAVEQAATVAKTVEPKAAEPKQEINGEMLLKMVDQLAFRTSKSNQSDTYYKPTPVETKLIDSLAKYSKDMVKSAGIDSRSAQAKPFRAKCLAEWAQSPQGKSGVTKLMQVYGNMKAFEKPREKQPLMQTLQAQTRAQANQGQSLMGELNKQQAKNNAAKAAQTAQVARAQTGASR